MAPSFTNDGASSKRLRPRFKRHLQGSSPVHLKNSLKRRGLDSTNQSSRHIDYSVRVPSLQTSVQLPPSRLNRKDDFQKEISVEYSPANSATRANQMINYKPLSRTIADGDVTPQLNTFDFSCQLEQRGITVVNCQTRNTEDLYSEETEESELTEGEEQLLSTPTLLNSLSEDPRTGDGSLSSTTPESYSETHGNTRTAADSFVSDSRASTPSVWNDKLRGSGKDRRKSTKVPIRSKNPPTLTESHVSTKRRKARHDAEVDAKSFLTNLNKISEGTVKVGDWNLQRFKGNRAFALRKMHNSTSPCVKCSACLSDMTPVFTTRKFDLPGVRTEAFQSSTSEAHYLAKKANGPDNPSRSCKPRFFSKRANACGGDDRQIPQLRKHLSNNCGNGIRPIKRLADKQHINDDKASGYSHSSEFAMNIRSLSTYPGEINNDLTLPAGTITNLRVCNQPSQRNKRPRGSSQRRTGKRFSPSSVSTNSKSGTASLHSQPGVKPNQVPFRVPDPSIHPRRRKLDITGHRQESPVSDTSERSNDEGHGARSWRVPSTKLFLKKGNTNSWRQCTQEGRCKCRPSLPRHLCKFEKRKIDLKDNRKGGTCSTVDASANTGCCCRAKQEEPSCSCLNSQSLDSSCSINSSDHPVCSEKDSENSGISIQYPCRGDSLHANIGRFSEIKSSRQRNSSGAVDAQLSINRRRPRFLWIEEAFPKYKVAGWSVSPSTPPLAITSQLSDYESSIQSPVISLNSQDCCSRYPTQRQLQNSCGSNEFGGVIHKNTGLSNMSWLVSLPSNSNLLQPKNSTGLSKLGGRAGAPAVKESSKGLCIVEI
uniref:E3 ubiquitin-protein ligase TRIP12 n=1 Tax=Mesocestoides corti TaxID=53468 RepID=A0A5K3F473_MESCO